MFDWKPTIKAIMHLDTDGKLNDYYNHIMGSVTPGIRRGIRSLINKRKKQILKNGKA